MTIVEMDLLNRLLDGKDYRIENVTGNQKEEISQYFAVMKENLANYTAKGRNKIITILRDM